MNEFRRGDTFPFKVQITNANKEPITLAEIETLYVTCRERPTEYSSIIFQKKLKDVTIDDEGYCHVVFKPEDTQELAYGKYYFDMEVTLKSGFKKTELYRFELTEETTIYGGENSGN